MHRAIIYATAQREYLCARDSACYTHQSIQRQAAQLGNSVCLSKRLIVSHGGLSYASSHNQQL